MSHFGGGAAQEARSRSSSPGPESLSPLLAAGLAQAAARDQRKLDLLCMTQHFDFLQSFRPESVVKKFFADARKTAGAQPFHVPTVWPELMAGLGSAPCIAIGRLLDSDVVEACHQLNRTG